MPRLLVVTLTMMLLAIPSGQPAWAADHRDAASISEDPAADLNDIYFFRDPSDPTQIVLAMTVNPFSSTSTPGAHQFSSEVIYRFDIDLNGDAIGDRSISVMFTPVLPSLQLFRAELPGGIVIEGPVTRPTAARAANPAVITTGASGIQMFAGPRDDPFFFDVIGFNRFTAGGGLAAFSGRDGFAGQNVSAIVIRAPVSVIFGSSTVAGLWATTYRLPDGFPTSGLPLAQVDRTGVPAVSPVFIPAARKDAFNRGIPFNDARDFGATIVASLNALGTNLQNQTILGSVAIPDILKLDLSRPDGFPNGRRLQDDVIDTLLSLVLNQPASDGANANDVPFLTTFPFLAPPQQAP
ncbi:MAG: DUF4331 domain-containing protein [Alphaproteobacteria bacterium]|nr:DUF4331 domain-containing protein [Alphaproteobacteria bacterium]